MLKEIRRELVVSLIVSVIILVFFQPLSTWAWGWLVQAGNSAVEAYMDGIYRNAALGQRDYIGFISFQFFAFALLGAVTGVISTGMGVNPVRNLLNRIDNASSKRRILVLRIIGALTLIGLYLSTGSTLFRMYADLQLNTSFQQRITVLSPLLTDQEDKEIKAQWALMKSRADFDAINSRMEAIANTSEVQLPDLLLP